MKDLMQELMRGETRRRSMSDLGLYVGGARPGTVVAVEGRDGAWSIVARGTDTALVEHVATGERLRVPLTSLERA